MDDESVFVVIYRSPYPEDGPGHSEIVGIAHTAFGAQALAIAQIRRVNERSPISALDDYEITEHQVQP